MMRLWSIHPRYLDRQGLTACWREALLAQKVLRGETRGYRNHPQLERFREQESPEIAISAFLTAIANEARERGYRFHRDKIGYCGRTCPRIPVTTGQLDREWARLRAKLCQRSPTVAERWADVARPEPHPLFDVVAGPVATWERSTASND